MNDFTDFSDRLLLLVIKQVESYIPGKYNVPNFLFLMHTIFRSHELASNQDMLSFFPVKYVRLNLNMFQKSTI